MSDRSFFAGWHRRWTLRGVEFVRGGGVVGVSFAVTPILPIARIVREQLALMRRQGCQVEYRQGQRGQTSEGEHCASFVLTGHQQGRPLERRIGVVYGNHHMVMIDGLHTGDEPRGEFVAFIDSLLYALPLRDGAAVRFRRCLHAVPTGWAVRTRDMTTHLLAPDTVAFVTVLPAQRFLPQSMVQKFLYEDVLVAFEAAEPIVRRSCTTKTGLKGNLVTAIGSASNHEGLVVVITALLQDSSNHYAVRYERPFPRHSSRETEFMQIVDSLQPPPHPVIEPTSALAHWFE